MIKIDDKTYNIIRKSADPESAEKDYLECMILEKLFDNTYINDNMIFAGGASLSKSYKLSNRIAQDIDLVCTDFVDIPDIHSNKQLEKFKKNFNAKVFNDLKVRINEAINKNQQFLIMTDCDWRGFANTELFMTSPTLHLMYKSAFSTNLGHLCIEIIPRIYPKESIKYRSVIPYSINKPMGHIPTIRYENTFWDKVYALHSNTITQKPRSDTFFSRHYYDVANLSELNCVDLHKTKNMFFDIEKQQAKYTKKNLPALKTFSDISLLPDESVLKKLEEDYKQMSSRFVNAQPTWNNIVKTILKLNTQLKTL